jgi:hypothetical protein
MDVQVVCDRVIVTQSCACGTTTEMGLMCPTCHTLVREVVTCLNVRVHDGGTYDEKSNTFTVKWE